MFQATISVSGERGVFHFEDEVSIVKFLIANPNCVATYVKELINE